jgi:hypothetical protein
VGQAMKTIIIENIDAKYASAGYSHIILAVYFITL